MAGAVGGIIWLTGLPGSGKSTLACALEGRLSALRCPTTRLDGDDLRRGLCSELGFDRSDRAENVRRAAEVAALMARAGLVCIVALIAPYAVDRAGARSIAGRQDVWYLEVFVDAPLQVCEERDPKGLYRLARSGMIERFTGLADPYEPPRDPDVHVRTDLVDLETCVSRVLASALPRLRPATVAGLIDEGLT